MSEPRTEEERVAQIDACLAAFAQGRDIPLAVVREMWSERAAHHEFVGGTKLRRNAELYAIRDTFIWFRNKRSTAP